MSNGDVVRGKHYMNVYANDHVSIHRHRADADIYAENIEYGYIVNMPFSRQERTMVYELDFDEMKISKLEVNEND